MLGVGLTEVRLVGDPHDRHGAESAADYLCVRQTLEKKKKKKKDIDIVN